MTGQFKCREENLKPSSNYKAKRAIRCIKFGILAILVATVAAVCTYIMGQHLKNKKEEDLANAYTGAEITDGTLFPGSMSTSSVSSEQLDASEEIVNFDALRLVNPEIAGWIKIDGTPVDNPIVQTTNNEKYLKQAFTGESNLVGTAFFDYRIDLENGKALVVYGHHYKNTDKLFTPLLEYENQVFLNEHPIITLQLDGEEKSQWQIFSIARVNSSNTEETQKFYKLAFSSDKEYQEYLNEIQNASMYEIDTEVSSEKRLLVLSTCAPDNTERFLVCAIET